MGTEDGDGARKAGGGMGKRIMSFAELDVYKLAFMLQQDIFETSKTFPKEERFSLRIGSKIT